ncbi:MAG: hypothetical protein A4E53_02146 [Pelotomaculum sp. PtaB.Bin104]|nr:MAG: hypothetical protein A4E53_02146 [Pelotomaculum sp. PtaB.Bin104]
MTILSTMVSSSKSQGDYSWINEIMGQVKDLILQCPFFTLESDNNPGDGAVGRTISFTTPGRKLRLTYNSSSKTSFYSQVRNAADTSYADQSSISVSNGVSIRLCYDSDSCFCNQTTSVIFVGLTTSDAEFVLGLSPSSSYMPNLDKYYTPNPTGGYTRKADDKYVLVPARCYSSLTTRLENTKTFNNLFVCGVAFTTGNIYNDGTYNYIAVNLTGFVGFIRLSD